MSNDTQLLTNTVLSTQSITPKDGSNNDENGCNARNHSYTDSLNDDGGRTSNSGLSNRLSRPEGVRSKVFCGLANKNASNKADGNARVAAKKSMLDFCAIK
jgi:hypothetical protein